MVRDGRNTPSSPNSEKHRIPCHFPPHVVFFCLAPGPGPLLHPGSTSLLGDRLWELCWGAHLLLLLLRHHSLHHAQPARRSVCTGILLLMPLWGPHIFHTVRWTQLCFFFCVCVCVCVCILFYWCHCGDHVFFTQLGGHNCVCVCVCLFSFIDAIVGTTSFSHS